MLHEGRRPQRSRERQKSTQQVRQGAAKPAKPVAQRRLAVLDLKRATAIGVVMQRMKCAAHLISLNSSSLNTPSLDICSLVD